MTSSMAKNTHNAPCRSTPCDNSTSTPPCVTLSSTSSSSASSSSSPSHLGHLWLQCEVLTAMESLDKKERWAYQTAVDVVPALVQSETPVMDFLRTEHMNPVAAARRLAAYWKYRKHLFGERWLLPMTQTGRGALGTREIALLRTGYQVVFPRSPHAGLLVVIDFARIGELNEDLFDSVVNIRVTFYLCTVLTDEATQRMGATGLYIVRSGQAPPVDTNPEGWKILHQSLPVRIQQMLVARAFVPGKEGILNYLAYQRARVNEFRSGLQPQQLIADSMQGTLALLQAKGCDRRHLPSCVGGDWHAHQFEEWVRGRMRVEDLLAPEPIGRNAWGAGCLVTTATTTTTTSPIIVTLPESGVGTPDNSTNSTALVVHSTKNGAINNKTNNHNKKPTKRGVNHPKKTPIGDMHNKAEQDRQRKLNALYSRRAYHKRKIEVVAMQQQIKALQTHQQILQDEAQQLQAAFAQAQQIVSNYTADSTA